MPVEKPLNTIHVRYKGLFDFEKLYDFVYDWMHERKYRTQEKKYKNKPDSAWGYEHEVKMYGTKKVDEFYKYRVDVRLHVRDGAEVEFEGKKLMKGRLHIRIFGKVILDYAGRWEKNAFTEWLRDVYLDVIIRKEWEMKHLDVLHYRLHDFQQEMKKMLNMYAEENYFKGS